MCEIAIVSSFQRNPVNFLLLLALVNCQIVEGGSLPNETAYYGSFEIDIFGI